MNLGVTGPSDVKTACSPCVKVLEGFTKSPPSIVHDPRPLTLSTILVRKEFNIV